MGEAYSVARSARTDKPDYSWVESMIRPQPWMRDAKCREIEGDLWFPDRADAQTARRAKDVCNRCPVMDACLEWSLGLSEDDHGILGGKSVEERRNERKKRAAA